jgi:hypothetical protein
MERLIRYRGLTKRVISRRARLLHNVYAWMRIISESTNVLHDEVQSSKCTEPSAAANCCTAENPAEGSSLHDSQEVTARGLDDFLYLEEYRTQANHNATTHRDSSEGQLDLHLTNPLIDRDGMCMQIYGVPETWLRLVSQTTRLANMLDELDPSTAGADMEVFARLQTTSATLESAVCAFKERFRPLLPGPSLERITRHLLLPPHQEHPPTHVARKRHANHRLTACFRCRSRATWHAWSWHSLACFYSWCGSHASAPETGNNCMAE